MFAKPLNVMVGTPCYGGLLTHVYVHSLLKLREFAAEHEIGIGLWTAAHDALITRCRNTIVAGFLDSSATHLMFIDADLGFTAEQFGRMLALDEDVVCGVYPLKTIDWAKLERRAVTLPPTDALPESGLHFVGVPCSGAALEEREGFVTGEYAGAGFMLIRRSAIERLIVAYPALKYRCVQAYPPRPRQSDHQYSFFDCAIGPDGTYLSEDYAFCQRWRAIGGKVWLDTRGVLRHVGSYEFSGRPSL
ncbi:MAG TPA: hypothetical protein VGM06_19745 [Polyangiaceae bacterium]|jgi:hypothetical protein